MERKNGKHYLFVDRGDPVKLEVEVSGQFTLVLEWNEYDCAWISVIRDGDAKILLDTFVEGTDGEPYYEDELAQQYDEHFEGLDLEQDGLRVELEYIGEGSSGDYDPSDPEDVPLLRFTCFRRVGEEFVPVEAASYCTQLTTRDDPAVFKLAMGVIITALEECLERGSGLRKRMEELSWLSKEDFIDKEVGSDS